jgi:hypothetical protein
MNGRLLPLFVVPLLLCARSADAQDSLADTLSFLLTTQAVPTGDFVKDRQSAQITRDTIERLLLIELTTTPLSSSSGGFSYRFNPAIGTVERASGSFGPFFTERSLTIGPRRVSVGAQAQVAHYEHLDDYDLLDGTFLTTANQFRDERLPFDVENLTLDMRSTALTLFGNLGLHDRIDVGLAVPIVALTLEGSRINVYRGSSLLQASASAEASGFGDIAVRPSGVSIVQEVRLPTGREEDLLGSGETSFRTVFIGSAESGSIGVHGNLGTAFGGLTNVLDYRGAFTVTPISPLTLVAELLGRRIADVGSLVQERVPHPQLAGVDTIRLTSNGESVNTASFVIGAKWNVSHTWLANFNVAVPLTSRGLRSDVAVVFGFDYAFERRAPAPAPVSGQ